LDLLSCEVDVRVGVKDYLDLWDRAYEVDVGVGVKDLA
jgi:hypothetical protein